MNWTRVLLGAVAGGVALNLVSFVSHGLILADTYRTYDQVFEQEPANPAFFVVTSLILGLVAAVLFAKTRASWRSGLTGGILFGLLVGLLPGFTNFFWPIVFAGFPYHLAWCWLGIDVLSYGAAGAVFALIIK